MDLPADVHVAHRTVLRVPFLTLGDTLCFCFFPSSLDASEALALPGVVDVITAQDVPGDNGREEESLYAQDEVCDDGVSGSHGTVTNGNECRGFIYVYTYVCIYACIYAYLCVYTYTYVYTCILFLMT